MTTPNTTTSRFEGLRAHLAGLPREQFSVRLPFTEIEELIGQPLPPESSKWEWWTDSDGPDTPQSRAWTTAGFGIGVIAGLPNKADKAGWVQFVRGLHRYPRIVTGSVEFGRLSPAERLGQLANAYLESGKLLCVHLGENPDELTWPRGAVVCFCYRHALELFLKSCILQREPIDKCDHRISNLRRQYRRLYPGKEFDFRTPFDIGWGEIKELVGDHIEIEDFERNEDQVYRYFGDKQGRSPKVRHGFGPGMWLSTIDQLEIDMDRIRGRIRASEITAGPGAAADPRRHDGSGGE
ncbi:MAG: hypothetical protein J2P46_21875 [Zavarzinella sp.]|nr:hypothetical protein [Zavarzinella sp.]